MLQVRFAKTKFPFLKSRLAKLEKCAFLRLRLFMWTDLEGRHGRQREAVMSIVTSVMWSFAY